MKDASSFGSAGIFVVIVFALFTSFGGVKSAVTTLIAGAAVWFISHYFFSFELSYILALGAALASYLFVGFLEKQRAMLTQSEVRASKAE